MQSLHQCDALFTFNLGYQPVQLRLNGTYEPSLDRRTGTDNDNGTVPVGLIKFCAGTPGYPASPQTHTGCTHDDYIGVARLPIPKYSVVIVIVDQHIALNPVGIHTQGSAQ